MARNQRRNVRILLDKVHDRDLIDRIESFKDGSMRAIFLAEAMETGLQSGPLPLERVLSAHPVTARYVLRLIVTPKQALTLEYWNRTPERKKALYSRLVLRRGAETLEQHGVPVIPDTQVPFKPSESAAPPTARPVHLHNGGKANAIDRDQSAPPVVTEHAPGTKRLGILTRRIISRTSE